ncbi:MAG: hypothetical protein ABSG68_19810 [Thermoguttaceae bacterium]
MVGRRAWNVSAPTPNTRGLLTSLARYCLGNFSPQGPAEKALASQWHPAPADLGGAGSFLSGGADWAVQLDSKIVINAPATDLA